MKTAELIQKLEEYIQTLDIKLQRAHIRLIRRSIKRLSEYVQQQPAGECLATKNTWPCQGNGIMDGCLDCPFLKPPTEPLVIGQEHLHPDDVQELGKASSDTIIEPAEGALKGHKGPGVTEEMILVMSEDYLNELYFNKPITNEELEGRWAISAAFKAGAKAIKELYNK